MKHFFKLSSLLCMFFTLHLFSQNENTKWYFGKNAALDFMTNPPTALNNSAMLVSEGCSSIADGVGNLLFYTDGVTVFNQQHVAMNNGAGLAGNTSMTQGALIVKKPGSSTLYYIFTVCMPYSTYSNPAALSGVYYSIVDMSLAAGIGSVTVKNVPLLVGTNIAGASTAGTCEKLAGTYHGNGTDVWIMTHDFQGYYPGQPIPLSNIFRAFLLTSVGITSTVISSVGTAYGIVQVNVSGSNLPSSNTGQQAGMGEMKFSPNGQKLGSAIMHTNITNQTSFPELGCVEMYDFDNCTGTVSNPLTLLSNTFVPYGCEFSPNGTKFYASNGQIMQWDLSAGSAAAIQSSSVTISNTGGSGMQLAPDGKIYIATFNSPSLSVINNPNAAGANCNFAVNGQNISTVVYSSAFSGTINTASYLALPNMLLPFSSFSSSCYSSSPCNISFATQISNILCSGTTGNASITNLFGNQGSVSYLWNNGLVTYTTAQVSNLSAGVWSITVTDALNCSSSQTFAISQQSVLVPTISSSSSNDICAGNSITLTASGASTYTWNTGAQGLSIIETPTITTQYFVSATDANGCTGNSTTLTINVVSAPELTVSGNLNVCGAGNSTTLTASGANSYTWNNGMQTPSIIVNPTNTTQYLVLGASQSECVGAAAVTVNIVPPPTLTVSGTFTLCSPQPQTLTVLGAHSYLWNWATTSSWAWVTSTFLIINPAVTTQYSVTGTDESGCSSSKVVTVSVITCTGVDEEKDEDIEFRIYPNPASEILNIANASEKTNIKLFDVLDKEIYSQTLEIKNGAVRIDVSDLPKGIYFIRITKGQLSVTTKKFVKE